MSTATTPAAGVLLPPTPDTTPIKNEVSIIIADAKAFSITSNDELVEAGARMRIIAQKKAEVDAKFDIIIKPAHAAHKSACDLRNEVKAPLDEADRLYRTKTLEYTRKMEDERRRQEQEERELQEAMAREDRERRAAELADQAAVAEKAGDTLGAESLFAEAQNVEAAPVIVAPVAMAPLAPKVAGVSTRENWQAEVTDLMALVKAVAAGTVPILAIQADTAFLSKQAKAMKSLLSYPGVRAYDKGGISVRK
jgi:hypothetical protein